MNNLLKVAVMLTAYDQLSRTVQEAVGKSKSQLNDLNRFATKSFAQGAGLMGAGQVGFNAIGRTIEEFSELQDASLNLKSVLMNDGGIIDNSILAKLDNLAIDLGNKLPGTTADMDNLFAVMKKNGEDANNILNGVGASAANLAIALEMPYAEAGKFAVKMKTATGTANKDMMDLMDTIARVSNLGVEASEMQFAFGRSSGALKLMNIQGLEASKSLAAVYAMLIRNGKSGETVGTGMSAVFNSFMNADKMNALNEATKKYGISMSFVDKKTGAFKGVENMIVQFNKLKGLNSSQRAGIVQAFLGPGQDADFMNTLIAEGLEGFNKINKQMSAQATLTDKVNIKMSGLKNTEEAMSGSYSNLLATMGATLAPALTKIYKLINNILGKVQAWFQANPKFAQFIMLTATFVSTALMIGGVIKIIQGIIAVMQMLNIVVAMNPFVLIAAAIGLIAIAIYTWWDDIVAYFKGLWNKAVAIFTKAWHDIKIILLHAHPAGLIYYYWDDIVAFFSKVWDRVKVVFHEFINWIMGIGKRFYDAGANIANQIYEGIKTSINKPVEAVANMTKKMRDYLPFSPAKAGAFRDLHKVKIVETIAQAIKPAPLLRTMESLTGSLAGVGIGVRHSGGSSGSVVVHYSPVIHIGSGNESDRKSFIDTLKENERELVRVITDAVKKAQRGRYN